MADPGELLEQWILRQAAPDGGAWFSKALEHVGADDGATSLFRHIGFASRKLGRVPLALEADDIVAAEAARTGWRPDRWSLDSAARVALLLHRKPDAGAFFETFEKLCRMGEMQELVAYYQGLPLYPEPSRYRARAAEGLRTNMQVVFEAVAHDNPYPGEQLEEGAWNQMVLKALFIGSRLAPMQGLERRANARLTRMLCDYAHERWAASRTISPELWRCVGRAPDDGAIEDLRRALSDPDPGQRAAAALALWRSEHPGAVAVLVEAPQLRAQIEGGSLSWDTLPS